MGFPLVDVLKKAGLFALGAAIEAEPTGIAKQLVKGQLGMSNDSTDEQMVAALEANPEHYVALRKIENEHSRGLEALRVEDRKDARGMRVALKGDNRIVGTLSFIAIIGLLGVIFTLIFVELGEGVARDALLVLLGSLAAIVKDVYGFFFGSSSGSKSKDTVIANGRAH